MQHQYEVNGKDWDRHYNAAPSMAPEEWNTFANKLIELSPREDSVISVYHKDAKCIQVQELMGVDLSVSHQDSEAIRKILIPENKRRSEKYQQRMQRLTQEGRQRKVKSYSDIPAPALRSYILTRWTANESNMREATKSPVPEYLTRWTQCDFYNYYYEQAAYRDISEQAVALKEDADIEELKEFLATKRGSTNYNIQDGVLIVNGSRSIGD